MSSNLPTKTVVNPPYVHFDGMCWPFPCVRVGDLEWKLRYSPESLTRADQLVAASVIAAYAEIVFNPIRVRNAIVRQLRQASYETLHA